MRTNKERLAEICDTIRDGMAEAQALADAMDYPRAYGQMWAVAKIAEIEVKVFSDNFVEDLPCES